MSSQTFSATSGQESPQASPKGTWFGFAAAAAAWVVYGAAWELIAAKACQNGQGNWGALSPLGVRWLLAGINIACLAVAVAAGITAFHNWRALNEKQDVIHAEGRGRAQFLALTGIFVSVVFSLGIVWAGLPLIMVDICIKAR